MAARDRSRARPAHGSTSRWAACVAGRTSPWVANGALELDGRRHRLGGMRGAGGGGRGADCRDRPPRRHHGPRDRAARADRAWVYADPPGGEHHALNCSIAAIEVEHDGRRLAGAHGGVYELGTRDRGHGSPGTLPDPVIDPAGFTTARMRAEPIGPQHREGLVAVGRPARRRDVRRRGTPAEIDDHIAGMAAFHAAHGYGWYAWLERDSGVLVARGGLQPATVDGAEEIEVGWAVLPERWGQGLATELGAAPASRWRSASWPADVVSFTLPDNIALAAGDGEARHDLREDCRLQDLRPARRVPPACRTAGPGLGPQHGQRPVDVVLRCTGGRRGARAAAGCGRRGRPPGARRRRRPAAHRRRRSRSPPAASRSPSRSRFASATSCRPIRSGPSSASSSTAGAAPDSSSATRARSKRRASRASRSGAP